ncbi:MAG: hypothetical protein A3I32_00110 [Candidatus Yanofskybacteria bacterium RIFCSPLOWO2_02_FULL_45_10]|uniref:VanZ-like domain-containing protein n=2 Tax=Candidatus Yanofskyibacteriota TaxID=1752733 RepID=A0A1F8G0R9_9BACT|nr:MAG: hypothetical protein A3F25_02580 [Candidatus Yanofskybacteria bacterium RIFCSPHIGHO2_12_FULL_45_19b]OGN31532.1 MAG: hypothetical protein A3I32_00110 [Candidatus Yanofskybacteria bacterium RIFCSPLOWO2_02_FULL_45_10]
MIKKYFPNFLLLLAVVALNTVTYYAIPETYDRLHLNKLMHFLGGFGIALLFSTYFSHRLNHLPALDFFLIIVGYTMLVGICWEFAEYSARYFPPIDHYFYIGDLTDTLRDLLSDLFGGFLVALHLLWRRQA